MTGNVHIRPRPAIGMHYPTQLSPQEPLNVHVARTASGRLLAAAGGAYQSGVPRPQEGGEQLRLVRAWQQLREINAPVVLNLVRRIEALATEEVVSSVVARRPQSRDSPDTQHPKGAATS
jgi:hypothetical protein